MSTTADPDAETPAAATRPGRHRIVLLPGDGIGPEIVDACRPVLAAAFPTWDFTDARIGWECWRTGGDPVPPQTWRALESSDAALMAAITSKPAREAEAELAADLRGTGLTYRSPVLQLRQRLDLFANVRPVEDVLHDDPARTPHAAASASRSTVSGPSSGPTSGPRFGFTVVRENTEGLYSHDFSMRGATGRDATGSGTVGRDSAAADPAMAGIWGTVAHDPTVARSTPEDTAVALRVTTGFAWRRLLRTAATLTGRAADPSLRRVTVADKPNILRESGAIIRDAVEEVAAEFPDVDFDIANADAVAMRMITRPRSFDVIAAENLLGDMLSDLGAGLMGGLGLPSSGNIGADRAVFEPVHGSAPDIAGHGVANPAAFLLSAAMCADHLANRSNDGSHDEAADDLRHRAARLRTAVIATLKTNPTPDLGGTNTTSGFAGDVAARLAS
ncbi:isocitrate/isopropylmalate family dehydrogenase [Corynebacterium freneyi]